MTKICTICQLDKELECFYPHKTGKLGRNSVCAPCCVKRVVKEKQAKREAIKLRDFENNQMDNPIIQQLTSANKIACIGTREPTDQQIFKCALIGAYIALTKKKLLSGNAIGCDQSYATGANRIAPELVFLFLPYKTYNAAAINPKNNVIWEPRPEWSKIAAPYHPIYDNLNRYAKGAMDRNAGIVSNSDLVIALPSKKGGGTAHGMRVANGLGIPLLNIYEPEILEEIVNYITPILNTT